MKKTFLITLLFLLIGFSNLLKAQDLIVYQYWNSTIHRHFYTTNHSELGDGGNGWVTQGIVGRLLSTGNASTAIYRFYNTVTATHYYTMNVNVFPDGFHLENIMGYRPIPPLYSYPVYEFYNSGDYYYSTNSAVPNGYTSNGKIGRAHV